MKTIYRYDFLLIDALDLKHPHSIKALLHTKVSATLIYCGIKNGILCFWAELDPATADCQIGIELVATGQRIEGSGIYFQTVSFVRDGKGYFLHVYIPKEFK